MVGGEEERSPSLPAMRRVSSAMRTLVKFQREMAVAEGQRTFWRRETVWDSTGWVTHEMVSSVIAMLLAYLVSSLRLSVKGEPTQISRMWALGVEGSRYQANTAFS